MDLNADLGEGFGHWTLGDDRALLDVVTSANIACGYHAGDANTMRTTCADAASAGVAVGAHVGYNDLPGFGRRFVDVAPDTLTNEVIAQLGALTAFARAAGTRVTYVKPHGALYNTLTHHEPQADAVVDAVRLFDPSLAVLGQPGAVWLKRAQAAGLRVWHEAFADRAYTPTGTLVPRNEPGAVLRNPSEIAARCVQLATEGWIRSITGKPVQVNADSICVHGDTPNAVEIAQAVRKALEAAGVHVSRVETPLHHTKRAVQPHV